MLIRADALRPPLRPGIAQAVVTSPPYLRQRVYGDSPNEGGREESLAAYVAWLADVLDQVRPLMDRRALLWLNIGDKANGSGGAGGDWSKGQANNLVTRQQRESGPGKFTDREFEEGSYLDVPGAVVAELIRRRWRLRLPIVWDKGREAPESLHHVRRPRSAHEMIFLLSPWARPRKGRPDQQPRFYPTGLEETGSVWHFPPGGSGPAHLAPFPDELARRCILASTIPGDLVLDPFDGSGTTRRVATAHGRRGLGLDLYAGMPFEELLARGVTSPRDARRRTGSTRDEPAA